MGNSYVDPGGSHEMDLLTLPHLALSVTQLLSVRGPQSALTCLGNLSKHLHTIQTFIACVPAFSGPH